MRVLYDINDYFEANTIKEAIDYLKINENSKIIAGGTDVLIKSRERKKDYIEINLVGVTRIPELKEIKFVDRGIFIGAACTFTEIEDNEIVSQNLPSLKTAVGTVGGPQVRNMGTMGGNISNGATSADSASTLFVLEAILIIENENGRREVSILDFYKGPGWVKLEPTDVVVGFIIPESSYEGCTGHYIKFAQRNAMDIATLGCSVLVRANGNVFEEVRIAFGVAGPTPIRAITAEKFASGKEITNENIVAISEQVLNDTKARDSWRGSKAFRENLAVTLCQRCIKFSCKGVL